MSVVKRAVVGVLLLTALLSPVPAQDSERQREELRERLEEVLSEANIEAERAREVMRIMERRGWGDLEPEDIDAILPALGYAQREGTLPTGPEELAGLARGLGENASQLRRLGFTSRETARNLSLEVRRSGLPRAPSAAASGERELPESARRAIRRAEQERLRGQGRGRGRDGERGGRPGFVPGTPRGEAPVGFKPGGPEEPGAPGEVPDDDYFDDDDD